MRGTLYHVHAAEYVVGIIPAYAGNTNRRYEFAGTRWDHPRVCGEHSSVRCSASLPVGSSPRMRGTHQRQGEGRDNPGIIPAYAGNTDSVTDRCYWEVDHPRVCGEHLRLRGVGDRTRGSSPRMRGTHSQQRIRLIVSRIIPAYAGNTGIDGARLRQEGDHPRVCGEHRHRKTRMRSMWGSSPRMRGTLMRHDLP